MMNKTLQKTTGKVVRNLFKGTSSQLLPLGYRCLTELMNEMWKQFQV